MTRNAWPLALDTRDPERIASFCLSLGYDHEKVVKAVATRCSLDMFTARQIVAGELRNLSHKPEESP